MTTGAHRADVQPDGSVGFADQSDWSVVPMSSDYGAAEQWEDAHAVRTPVAIRILAMFTILLGMAWLGGASWVAYQTEPALTPEAAVRWIPVVCAPLILLALLWIMVGRTPRRETERFTRAVAAMRGESAALESLLGLVATRLEENHERLTREAAKLMSLGDEASDRLGRVAHYLSKESGNLDRKSQALESAAEAARIDIGVLLNDLPRAEEQARAVAEAMKQAGLGAHEQAGSLEGQLSALIARGREADEVVGGAAQRLAAHLARIESTTSTATTRMDEAAASMSAAIDGSMTRAAEAVDAARSGLEAQGNGMLAMIEQSRASLERAGEDAGRHLATRLETVGTQIEHLAEHLAAQDAASQALVSSLARDLSDLDQRFSQLAESGVGGTERLEGSLQTVRQAVQQLEVELGSGTDRAGELLGRAQQMAQALGGLTEQLNEGVPGALSRIEEQAERTRATAAAIGPEVEAIQGAAEATAGKVGEAEASLMRQQEAFDQLLGRINSEIGTAGEQLRAFGAAAEDADAAARRLVAETGPELIESLLRVREAANQAAERAREAIASVIPESASSLGEASRQAVIEAVGQTVQEQMTMLTDLAEKAVTTARRASERLTRQMLTIGQTTAAIEARIDETERDREEQESQQLSRRVALLIESLNSTAIDVTKILSNEVTDTAWTAYLKGDRGVFTRRAVRLLSSGEARAIAQHYEEDKEFREQVNRYIHDFEAMLRRILADRDGSPLGVTLLSSDMGKLYVALAQAIERLR
jgi:hypothetical protein